MRAETGPDGLARCPWGNSAPEYLAYHDDEWGWPVADDRRLFEKLCLESFQSGLAWITVLRKRDALRRAFHHFDPVTVAAMDTTDVERLVTDPSIIRHRGKIQSVINNAGCVLALQERQSLASLVWAWEPDSPSPDASQTSESLGLARELKKEGFTWLGPTTVYAFMQAMGVVNDHIDGCHIRGQVNRARASFPRPNE